MENNDELRKVDIKNRACYYIDDIIKMEDFDLNNILLDKNHMNIFWFMTFYTILWFVQNLYILGSIK